MNKINKKIRILTFHSAYSYGAVLQTFALYTFLNERYDDVKVVDFRPEYFSIRFSIKNPKSWIVSFLFGLFKRKIAFTKRCSAETLRSLLPKADVYIIGSDQVWNPSITKDVRDIYFGDFIPDNKTKIAYAASFGRTEFAQDEIADFKRYIHGFKAISCREESGVDICRHILGVSAQCVLDPTFLIDNWAKIFNLKLVRNELCLFVLNNSTNECFEFARIVANELSLKPKVLNKNKKVAGFKVIRMPSVVRFLSEIYSSQFSITNSFHGLAFSILFEKDFLYVCTDDKGTRAFNLLKKLGLENRFFNSYDAAMKSRIWKQKIDYSIVNAKKEILINEAIEFLLSNIL